MPTPTNTGARRTAVFIDGDWLIQATRQLKLALDYKQLARAFQQKFGPIALLHFFVSTDRDNRRHQEYISALISTGFMVHAAEMKRYGQRTLSSGLDVMLSVQAVALLPEIDRLILVSGDADFVPLLSQIKNSGRIAVLVALPLVTSRSLVNAAENFVSLEELLADQVPRSPDTISVPAPPSELYIEKGNYVESYRVVRDLFKAAKQRVTVIDIYINDQVFYWLELVPKSASVAILTSETKLKNMVPDVCVLISKMRREGRNIRA
jgi:uncharacterized LabA/DUF88 family protein